MNEELFGRPWSAPRVFQTLQGSEEARQSLLEIASQHPYVAARAIVSPLFANRMVSAAAVNAQSLLSPAEGSDLSTYPRGVTSFTGPAVCSRTAQEDAATLHLVARMCQHALSIASASSGESEEPHHHSTLVQECQRDAQEEVSFAASLLGNYYAHGKLDVHEAIYATPLRTKAVGSVLANDLRQRVHHLLRTPRGSRLPSCDGHGEEQLGTNTDTNAYAPCKSSAAYLDWLFDYRSHIGDPMDMEQQILSGSPVLRGLTTLIHDSPVIEPKAYKHTTSDCGGRSEVFSPPPCELMNALPPFLIRFKSEAVCVKAHDKCQELKEVSTRKAEHEAPALVESAGPHPTDLDADNRNVGVQAGASQAVNRGEEVASSRNAAAPSCEVSANASTGVKVDQCAGTATVVPQRAPNERMVRLPLRFGPKAAAAAPVAQLSSDVSTGATTVVPTATNSIGEGAVPKTTRAHSTPFNLELRPPVSVEEPPRALYDPGATWITEGEELAFQGGRLVIRVEGKSGKPSGSKQSKALGPSPVKNSQQVPLPSPNVTGSEGEQAQQAEDSGHVGKEGSCGSGGGASTKHLRRSSGTKRSRRPDSPRATPQVPLQLKKTGAKRAKRNADASPAGGGERKDVVVGGEASPITSRGADPSEERRRVLLLKEKQAKLPLRSKEELRRMINASNLSEVLKDALSIGL